jgi:hypothetical protein
MTPPRPGDLRAGVTGLIVGSILLLGAMYAIVQLTNVQFAGHERAKAEAPK